MKPEIIINKSAKEDSMRSLAEHMQHSINVNDWESFLIYLRASWEWVYSDKSMQSSFDQYFLAECRWLAQQDKFKIFEEYCLKFLLEDVITTAIDKENAERSQKDVSVVIKYWFRHIQAAYFLTPQFLSKCLSRDKYFYDFLFLQIRLENAHQNLWPLDVDLDGCWANVEDAKLFLKSVMRQASLIPLWLMVTLMEKFFQHRELLWHLVSDHPHRFVLFRMMAENYRRINFTESVFKKWSEECQKELNPWDRALSDKMIFKTASREAFYDNFVFSSLILVRPGDHYGRAQCPESIVRSDFWPHFFFKFYAPSDVYFSSQRLSSDYLIYSREPAKVLTKSLCHAWVLDHLTIRQYLNRVSWSAVKKYDPVLADQLEKVDLKEERGYFFWNCLRKNGGWNEWLMAYWVILDSKRLRVLSKLKQIEWMLGCAPSAYLAELQDECLILNQFLSEIKKDLLTGQMLPDFYKKTYRKIKSYQEKFEYHIKALDFLQENKVLLMDLTNCDRKDLLEYRWCRNLGYPLDYGALFPFQRSEVDNFRRYIPPVCLSAIGVPLKDNISSVESDASKTRLKNK